MVTQGVPVNSLYSTSIHAMRTQQLQEQEFSLLNDQCMINSGKT